MSRVFIGRLSYDTRESDVERFLRGYGRIREISLKKGYGFIVRMNILIYTCEFYLEHLTFFLSFITRNRNLTTQEMQKMLLRNLTDENFLEKGIQNEIHDNSTFTIPKF